MYAFSADTYTIRQKEIRRAVFLQELHLKTSLKAGCARHVEWEWNTSRKRNNKCTVVLKNAFNALIMASPYILLTVLAYSGPRKFK